MREIEFYLNKFLVNENVLCPRPETEDIVELFIEIVKSVNRIIEIGTGSAALIITLANLYPKAKLVATDISEAALEVAGKNSKKYGVNLELIRTNLLDGIATDGSDILVANLPYLSKNSKYLIKRFSNGFNEPDLALYGGKTGLELIYRLFDYLKKINTFPKYVFIESDIWQQPFITDKALSSGYRLIRQYRLITVFAH